MPVVREQEDPERHQMEDDSNRQDVPADAADRIDDLRRSETPQQRAKEDGAGDQESDPHCVKATGPYDDPLPARVKALESARSG